MMQWANQGERVEVVLAGSGGQGLVYMGRVLGEVALQLGYYVSQTQSYGVASRGGFSKSEVVIARNPIAFPMVMNPKGLLTLTQEAYDRYISTTSVSVVVYDRDQVTAADRLPRAMGVPLTSEAQARALQPSYNLMALGAFLMLCPIIPWDAVRTYIETQSVGARREANLRALLAGVEIADTGRGLA